MSQHRLVKVGVITCSSLVIANMVGTGVFTSLGFQLSTITYPGVILMLWLLGGLFATCGALSYAELASVLPRSGGEYYYLTKIYHPAVGLMAGVISMVAGFAAPIALAAMAFGQYFQALDIGISPRIASTIIVTFITIVHIIHISASRAFQNTFTTLKITLVIAFIIAGFLHPTSQKPDFSMPLPAWTQMLTPSFAVALMFATYAYSGWNAATYIANEVNNPQRQVGFGLLIGTIIVTILYLLLNTSFLIAAPMDALRDKLDVGNVVAQTIFGPIGLKLLAGLICLGLISSISAMTWAGPRVSQVVGEDYRLFGFLARKSRNNIPVIAILTQYALVIIFLWTTVFENILIFTQFALIACSSLVVLGVFVLRIRNPELPRPFQCWGYPLTPLLFLAISIFTMLYTLINRPLEALAGMAALAISLLTYPIAKWYQNKVSRNTAMLEE